MTSTEGVDRVGQDLDRDVRPDRQHTLMDRGRRIRAGHRRPDELARLPVERQGDVADLRLEGVAARRRREVGDVLDRVDPLRLRLLEGQPDRGGLGIGVGRPGERPIVGVDLEAHRHPDRELALVVGLVGVELRAGRVADDPQPVRDTQPPVARERPALAGVDPVVLEAEVVEGERPADRQQDRVTLCRRSVVEVDDVGAVGAGTRPRAGRAHAEPQVHPISAEELSNHLGVPGVLGRHQAVAGLDDGRRHLEAGEDLGQLAARRPAAQHEQAGRQLAGERRLAVRPDPDAIEAGQRRHPRLRPDRDENVRRPDLVDLVVVADLDEATAGDAPRAPVADRARVLEPLDVGRVVGLRGVRRPVDHVVAGGGGALRVWPGSPHVPRRRRRLRRQAADVRASAEPAAVVAATVAPRGRPRRPRPRRRTTPMIAKSNGSIGSVWRLRRCRALDRFGEDAAASDVQAVGDTGHWDRDPVNGVRPPDRPEPLGLAAQDIASGVRSACVCNAGLRRRATARIPRQTAAATSADGAETTGIVDRASDARIAFGLAGSAGRRR